MTLQEQVKAAIEQEAREKYPIPERSIWDDGKGAIQYTAREVAIRERAAYVEGKMSMLSEIEKAWDASQKRTTWEFVVPDEVKAPPTKDEYINNLFK